MIVKRSSIPDVKLADIHIRRTESSVGDITGEPEEYGSDPQAAGGRFPPATPTPKADGADAPHHGSR
jgi:hypothetical protein